MDYKLVFAGPVGAGKTTAIAKISDIPVIQTDESASDMTQIRKRTTTVALDYGAVYLDGGSTIHLYGTPGQERFNFMWDILSENALGLVLMIDNSRPDPFTDLKFFLNTFSDFIHRTALVIGVTHYDLGKNPTITDYNQKILELGFSAPVFEVDGRVSTDIKTLIGALLYSLDTELVA